MCLAFLAFTEGFAGSKNPAKDSAEIIITLDNTSSHHSMVDSVYVIFDRFDHRGAGIVRQVFYPEHNKIRLTIPKGKYYVNIFCLGIYAHECFDRIITARTNKKHKLSLKLETSALFIPGFVTIPEEKFDPSRLSVTRLASSR